MVSESPVTALALAIPTVTTRLRITGAAARHARHAGAQLADVWRVHARRFRAADVHCRYARTVCAVEPTPGPSAYPCACADTVAIVKSAERLQTLARFPSP
ncbi:hypothetical protein FRC07_012994, partial [Ceratobasidium sp. 392]